MNEAIYLVMVETTSSYQFNKLMVKPTLEDVYIYGLQESKEIRKESSLVRDRLSM